MPSAPVLLSARPAVGKKAPLEKSLLDLKDVVNEVLALLVMSRCAPVTIRTDLPQDLPSVSSVVCSSSSFAQPVINGMDAMHSVEEQNRILFGFGKHHSTPERLRSSFVCKTRVPG